MTRSTGAGRQPLPHEWRRHSLVKVRRPAWSGRAPEGTPAQVVNTTSQLISSQTTYDDISW
jgi:hypothetical protein